MRGAPATRTVVQYASVTGRPVASKGVAKSGPVRTPPAPSPTGPVLLMNDQKTDATACFVSGVTEAAVTPSGPPLLIVAPRSTTSLIGVPTARAGRSRRRASGAYPGALGSPLAPATGSAAGAGG